MERTLITTGVFNNKLDVLCENIGSEFGGKAVIDFVNKIEIVAHKILLFPEMGRPMVHRKNVRSMIVKPHNRIFYKITPSQIILLDIVDMRSDPRRQPFV